MTLEELMLGLRARGLVLVARDGRLLLSGPASALDAAHRAAIDRHRATLIELLAQGRSALPPAIARGAVVPLTGTQRAIFVDHAVSGGTAYHMPFVVMLPAGTNLAAMSEALVDLAAAHPALTSRYHTDCDGLPVQQGLAGAGLVVERHRVAAAAIASVIEECVARPFDLAAGDVFRAALIEDDAGGVRLCVVAHHVAADGWSGEVMKRDLSRLYDRRMAGSTATGEVVGPFARYAAAAAHDGDAAGALAFWRAALAGFDDRGIGVAGGTAEGGIVLDADLDAAADAALLGLSDAGGASRYGGLVAALASAIGPMMACDELLVAVPRANRTRPGAQEVVGPFLDTLPLRVRADGADALPHAARAVTAQLADATRHGGMDFAEIRAALARDGVDVAPRLSINLLDYPRHPLILGGAVADEEDSPATDPKYDLTVYAEPGVDGLRLRYHARAAAFPCEALAALHERVGSLLRGAAASPGTPVAELARAGETIVSLPSADPGASVPERFRRQAAATPDAPALAGDADTWSYADLAGRVDALHRALVVDAPEAAPVCIVATRCRWLVVAILACLQAGRPYAILDAEALPGRADTAAVLRFADVLVAADHPVPLPPGLPAGIDAATIAASAASSEPPPWRTSPHPHAAACLTWTSGSTGEPLAVVGTHAALTLQMDAMQRSDPIGAGDRGALLGGLGNDPLQRDIFTPLCFGACLAVPPPDVMHPERLRPWLAARRVTILNLTPGMAEFACAAAGGDAPLDAVRRVHVCGDVLRGPVARALAATMPAAVITNLYGMTESQRALSVHVVRASDRGGVSDVPIGGTGPGTALVVRDRAGRPALPWTVGDLYLLGNEIAIGYADRPRETALRFVPAAGGGRMIRTGDRGRALPDGTIAFAGRADGEVNLRGMRFATAAVDRQAVTLPGVLSARTLLSGDGADAHLVTFWTGEAGVDEAALREHLRGRLPAGMVPGRAVRVASFPLNAAGKLDRAALVRQVPPRTGVRLTGEPGRTVAAVWQEVLGTAVHAGTDFFAAGGHSLQAIRLSEKLSATLGRRYPVDRLLGSGSLADCVAFYAEDPSDPPIVAVMLSPPRTVVPADPFPLTEVQQAYWLGRRDDVPGGSVPTATYLEFALPDADPQRLRAVLDRLVARHPMLRTIATADGLQRTMPPPAAVPLAVQDLRFETPAGRDAALDRWRTAMAERRFDPDTWPLFEVRLSLAAEGDARLHLAIDLMIVDYGSSRILLDEFRQLWRDPGAALPVCEYGFAQYAWWTHDRKASPEYRAARRHWIDRLPDLPGPPQLPLRTGPAAPPNFVRRVRRLDAAMWRRFTDRAQESGVTRSTALLAAYAEILSRWAEEQRFVINLTVFDRPSLHPHIDRVVGDFTSLMLVEADMRSGSFADRARRIQQEISRCLEHRAFDAVEVLRERSRQSGEGALAPVIFTNTLDAVDAAGSPDGGVVETLRRARSSQVWIDHTTGRDGDDVLLYWTTLDERFVPGLIERMFDAYGRLVETLAAADADWSRPPAALLPFSADGRGELDRSAEALPARLLHQGFLDRCAAAPESVALICSGRSWSYRELRDAAGGVAAMLRGAGVGRGELVAVTMAKGWQQVVAVLGIAIAGAAYLPIDPDLPPARRDRYLADAGVRIELAAGASPPLLI